MITTAMHRPTHSAIGFRLYASAIPSTVIRTSILRRCDYCRTETRDQETNRCPGCGAPLKYRERT